MVIFVIVIGFLIGAIERRFMEAKHEKLAKQAEEIIKKHMSELKIRRAQLTIKQGYGLIDDSRWTKEVGIFIDQVVANELGQNIPARARASIYQSIQAITEGFHETNASVPTSDPIAYEGYVASLLCGLGWDAHATRISGDQGVDIIALKNGKKLVVQCKLYSKPVGNRAVQEIVAGRVFERANFAAVVSNVGFTQSARQLATSSDVYLMHHDQLADLDNVISAQGRLLFPQQARPL